MPSFFRLQQDHDFAQAIVKATSSAPRRAVGLSSFRFGLPVYGPGLSSRLHSKLYRESP